MKIDEALYQLKQNIKMHEIDGTTSNQNEREKALLNYITNLQNRIDKAVEYIEKYCIDGVENEYNTPQTVFEEENGNEKDNARIELLDILRGK